MSSFKKFDRGKPSLSRVPVQAIAGIARVMEFGAQKYGQDNWKGCEEPRRYLDAAMRHLYDYAQVGKNDKESGMSHLWHAACNIAFMIYLEEEDG